MNKNNALLDLGYTKNEINKILSNSSLRGYKEETLIEKFKEIHIYFLKIGLSKNSIKKIVVSFPAIYSYTIDLLEQKRKNLESLGYTKELIIKILKRNPQLFAKNSIETTKKKIKNLEILEFTKEEIDKIIKAYPEIYGLATDRINLRIKELENLGYKKENIKKIFLRHPQLLSFSKEKINRSIEELESIGYTREDVIQMTSNFPEIFSLSIYRINKRINEFLELGYTKEEIIKITKTMPNIYGYNSKTIKEKLKYYNMIGIKEDIIENPYNLIHSVELIYAKYEFLKEKGIEIKSNNSKNNKLFYNMKIFQKLYQITKEELLSNYKYQDKEKKLIISKK